MNTTTRREIKQRRTRQRTTHRTQTITCLDRKKVEKDAEE